jgi:hypothetical protein
MTLNASCKANLVEPWAWLRDVLTQMPRGASLESLLPHTWLQTHPEHRWTIAERRKLERQRCSWKQHIRCRQNQQVRGHQGGGAEALA